MSITRVPTESERSTARRLRWALCGIALCASAVLWSPRSLAERAPRHRLPPARAASGSVALRASPAATTVRAYASAFATGRYSAMWRLLAPSARRRWSDFQHFAAFYRVKFAPVRMTGYTVGAVVTYGTGAVLPLSLHLRWRDDAPVGMLTLFDNLGVQLTRLHGAWYISDAGPLDARAPILPPRRPPLTSTHVPILMYHHVSRAISAPSQVGLTVTDHDFVRELAWLSAHGYHSVGLIDVFNTLYYGLPLPPHPIVLTFDDGYLDNYTDAFPLLRRYHMTAEFNIIAAYPGTTLGVNRYMTWRQIEELATAGMEIESHTVDHQDLGTLPPNRVAYELRFSRAMLAGRIHHAVQFLAYPAGEPFRTGSDAARAMVIRTLQRYGYVGALLDPAVPSTTEYAGQPFALSRVRVSYNEPLTAFAASVSGA